MINRLDLRNGDFAPLSDALSCGITSASSSAARSLGDQPLRVSNAELDEALRSVSPLLRESLEQFHASLLAFHRSEKPDDRRYDRDDVTVRTQFKPLRRAGLIVGDDPGMVLAGATPAVVAGVDELVICLPPAIDDADTTSSSSSPSLAAAALVGVDEVWRLEPAVAADVLLRGADGLNRVDHVAHCGNDSASTSVVIADETASREHVAADLLQQLETSSQESSWIVTWSEQAADDIVDALQLMAQRMAVSGLSERCRLVVVADAQSAVEVANVISPARLQLLTVDTEALLPLIRTSSVVIVGPWTAPVVVRSIIGASSALAVDDFLCTQRVVSLTEPSFTKLAPYSAALAEESGSTAALLSTRVRSRP